MQVNFASYQTVCTWLSCLFTLFQWHSCESIVHWFYPILLVNILFVFNISCNVTRNFFSLMVLHIVLLHIDIFELFFLCVSYKFILMKTSLCKNFASHKKRQIVNCKKIIACRKKTKVRFEFSTPKLNKNQCLHQCNKFLFDRCNISGS